MFSLVYALCGALTLVVCIFSRQIGTRLRVLDEPDGSRKSHLRSTPLVGGLAIIVPVVLTSALLALDSAQFRLFGTLILAALSFFAIGFADDHRARSPMERLFAQIVVTLAVLLVTPLFRIDELAFSFYAQAIPLGIGTFVFTLICIVGLVNAINMVDGRNGIAIGLMLIWTLLLFAYAPAELGPILLVLAIGLSITLVFNLKSALFLGDSGTYGIGVTLALITIYSCKINFAVFRADVVVLFFLIPVVDCLRLILVRTMQHGSPFKSGSDHFHHILQRLLTENASLVTYWALVGVPSVLALAFPEATLWWIALALAVYTAALLVDELSRKARLAPPSPRPEGRESGFTVGASDDGLKAQHSARRFSGQHPGRSRPAAR